MTTAHEARLILEASHTCASACILRAIEFTSTSQYQGKEAHGQGPADDNLSKAIVQLAVAMQHLEGMPPAFGVLAEREGHADLGTEWPFPDYGVGDILDTIEDDTRLHAKVKVIEGEMIKAYYAGRRITWMQPMWDEARSTVTFDEWCEGMEEGEGTHSTLDVQSVWHRFTPAEQASLIADMIKFGC